MVDGKGVGERVVLMDVVAEGRGVIARIAVGRFQGRERRIAEDFAEGHG